MKLILARHGNTFAPGDKVVWVGRETDLPLVEKGVAQAQAVAAALRAHRIRPARVFCGPLRRTRDFAAIIADALALEGAPIVDPRLDEIDYGRWAGKTAQEIAALGQEEALERWNREDIWPEDAGWGSREADIVSAVRGFLDMLRATVRGDEAALAVSSNGVLRFFPRQLGLAPPEGAGRSFRMRTGHLGVIDDPGGAPSLRCWNVPPDALAA